MFFFRVETNGETFDDLCEAFHTRGANISNKSKPLDFLGLQLYKQRPVVKIDGYDKTLICISTRPQIYTVYIYIYAYKRNKQFETRNQVVFLYVF